MTAEQRLFLYTAGLIAMMGEGQWAAEATDDLYPQVYDEMIAEEG